MRKLCAVVMTFLACGLLMAVTGCGGGTPEQDPSSSNPPPPPDNGGGGDLAPDSIGDNTIHGTFLSPHDHTTFLHFTITTTGGTTGSYTYEEENLPSNSGTYTWIKSSPNVAEIDTSNNGNLTLTYTSARAGPYEYARPGYDEQGTFTTDR